MVSELQGTERKDQSGRQRAISSPSARGRHGWRAALVAALSIAALAVAACGAGSSTTGNATPTVTPSTAAVKIFFSRSPESESNPAAVFPVTRTVASSSAMTAALEEIMKGPTTAEQAQGYYSALSGALALISTCSGEFRDFDLTYNHRGATVESGTLTFQFCRRVDIRGDLDGPRIQAMIRETAMQFSGIKDVVILNQDGNCFADLQGANACLNKAQTDSRMAGVGSAVHRIQIR